MMDLGFLGTPADGVGLLGATQPPEPKKGIPAQLFIPVWAGVGAVAGYAIGGRGRGA